MVFNGRAFNIVRWILVCSLLHGAVSFFVKHVKTGKCINDTRIIHSRGSWGNVSLVELSYNCLDPAAQFRFRDNSAMLNLKRPGCLFATHKTANPGYSIDMFYLYVNSKGLNTEACREHVARKTDPAIAQTAWGGLSLRYTRDRSRTLETMCILPKTDQRLVNNPGIDPYIGWTRDCNDAEDKRFNFGSVTCRGNIVENANCPKDQYMVVKTASYSGLSGTKTCGLSDDYSCDVDVTCLVKKQCDGQHECSITVDNNLFSGYPCPGLTKYLYFEYQCVNVQADYVCVHNVSLSNSSLPNEGSLQITTDSGTKSVCWQSLKNKVAETVCSQLGYKREDPIVIKTVPSSIKDGIFSRSIDCNAGDKQVSQCVFKKSEESCSELSYIKCSVCPTPLLEDKQRFPDSSLTASASSGGHSASDARISSGSSWCAPVSDGKHYLQVDLGRLYFIDHVAIFGDSTSLKYVTTYNLNYTVDFINWKSVSNETIPGNKNAYNDAAIQELQGNITTKALRFIPLDHVGAPCVRIEICGVTLLPDQPTNLTVTSIRSRSAEISWVDPVNTGDGSLTRFKIKLKKENSFIKNITTHETGKTYELENLSPHTKYEISVAVGNKHGFGEETKTSLLTSEEAPKGPPLNVRITAENSSSLSVTWEPPEKDKRNGKIVNYTVCISHKENGTCFKEYTITTVKKVIESLNASTKYYIRVLASTKVGRGVYSKNKGKFTNGESPAGATNKTEKTMTFHLQIPLGYFTHFYIVVLKLKDEDDKPSSPDSYENDLVTYNEARKSTTPQPYIAAVVTSKNENMFVLGDGTNTSNPTSRRRRSTSSDYYNGPLEPATSYSIFQRIFINEAGEFYSTDWSPASSTASQKTTLKTPERTKTPETTKTPGATEPTGKGGELGDDDSNSGVGAIVGAVVGCCVLLILVILAVIIFKRRRSRNQSEKKRHWSGTDTLQGPDVVNPAFDRSSYLNKVPGNNEDNKVDGAGFSDDSGEDFNTDEGYPTQTDIYTNQETAAARIHNPIPVEKFSDHVNKMRQSDNKKFLLEFEDLPTARISNGDISRRTINRPKNRYANAVTYNQSRVILSGDANSDYINASYIDGFTEKYYIATQGPKPNTVNDFWRMVFEQKCPTIVMLTVLKEMQKVKCEKYWPDESEIYGDIEVTITDTRTFADYVTRSFILKKGNEKHYVQQFHFKSWPDYGVPLYPTQILTFRRHFKSYHESNTGPAVVHCSAGVGRTGVFITIDKILDDLDKGNKATIDIFGFVKEMRTRRVNMVQTAEQYVFTHDAVVDHVQCGANEVEATQVTFEIKKLSEKNRKGQTGFEQKFKRLNAVSPELDSQQCEAALSEENRKKNRRPDIYPTESSRAYLKHIENVESSDYINACYVDGYLGKNYFIATQTPLTETINDFWRMVLQHNSSTIIMLNQLRENDEEYQMFWPTGRASPQSFGATTVMFDSFVKRGNIVTRKFIISPSADIKEGRMVRMIQYMSWPDHGVPENVDDIVKVLSEVEESQRAAEKKGPVVVVCSDGAGRSGTYIAISNLVDRVKVVQVIDVFQCIKMIRIRRPQFVETAAQFRLCYDVIPSVLQSFNEYSNFSSLDN